MNSPSHLGDRMFRGVGYCGACASAAGPHAPESRSEPWRPTGGRLSSQACHKVALTDFVLYSFLRTRAFYIWFLNITDDFCFQLCIADLGSFG